MYSKINEIYNINKNRSGLKVRVHHFLFCYHFANICTCVRAYFDTAMTYRRKYYSQD